MKAHWHAVNASPMEGADAAISARTADQCNRAQGQELAEDEDRTHVASIEAAKGRELGDRRKIKVGQGRRPGTLVDTRWGPTRRTVDGKKDVTARLVARVSRTKT